MGAGESQVSMAAQGINTTIQVANTTTQTILQLLLKERNQLRNPEALIVDIRDIDNVLNGLNAAGIPWTTSMQRIPVYRTDENGEKLLDNDGKPILIGYEEAPARTPDGMNCIIMVSGHDHPLTDPKTGELILTGKGNTKMIGGNIDKAVAIRNAVREERMKENTLEYNLSKDTVYQGDYVKFEFPGFESRARFADAFGSAFSLKCAIPSDFNDYSIYVRQDAFERSESGKPSLAEQVLKDYYFKEQFPEYAEHLEHIDKDIALMSDRINRATTDPNLIIRFDNPFENDELHSCVENELQNELFYIKNQHGYINVPNVDGSMPEPYDLTIEQNRNAFLYSARKLGYTYSFEGLEPTQEQNNDFAIRSAHDKEFIAFQNDITSMGVYYENYINDNIHLDFKNGDQSVEPDRGATWSNIEIRIDNTSLVGHINLDIGKDDPDKEKKLEIATDLQEKIRTVKETSLNQTLNVTLVDGKSLSANLYANGLVRNSEDITTKNEDVISKIDTRDKDALDEFQETYFANEDTGHVKDISEQETKYNDPSVDISQSCIDNAGELIPFEQDYMEQGDDDTQGLQI